MSDGGVSDRLANVVIRASAGTGKTFQLSNRYISLASRGEPLSTRRYPRSGEAEVQAIPGE